MNITKFRVGIFIRVAVFRGSAAGNSVAGGGGLRDVSSKTRMALVKMV
jgi:hypothetical protein